MVAVNIADDLLKKLERMAQENNTGIDEIVNHQLLKSFEPLPEVMKADALDQLTLATEVAQLGIWVIEVASGHLEWNDQLLKIYGITRFQFENDLDSWRNSVHPDDKDYANSRLGEAFTGKKVFDVLFRVIRPDGEVRYINGSATPVFDENNELIKVIGNNLDITDIKKNHDLLASHYAVVDVISEAIIIIKPDYTILDWNPHAEKMYGWKSEEVIGQSLADILPITYIDTTEEEVFQEFNEKGIWKGEVIQPHKSGKPIHVLSSISKMYNAQGQVTGFVGVNRDISARKRAEQSARAERDLLRNIIDNVPDYIFVKDRNGTYLETNVAHALAGGTSREEMLGHTAEELFDKDIVEQFILDDELVLTQDKTLVNEERVTTDDSGNKRWVLTTKVPLHDHDGQVSGLIGVSRDITELREMQAKRADAERVQFEIEQERKMIELKQRFIETASHDFRTPLAIIRSSTNVLQDYWNRLTDERRIGKLEKIQKQVDRMILLLNAVLSLSKLEAGKLQPQYTTIDLQEFCQRIWEDMLDINADNYLTSFCFDTTIEELLVDESMLEQILVNLLSNAFKYTGAGNKIDFEITQGEEWLTFKVIDQGLGIPEEDRQHLFEPFHRAKNVRNIEGTGLGLSIVNEYLLLLGGKLELESVMGKGTTITVFIPIKAKNS